MGGLDNTRALFSGHQGLAFAPHLRFLKLCFTCNRLMRKRFTFLIFLHQRISYQATWLGSIINFLAKAICLLSAVFLASWNLTKPFCLVYDVGRGKSPLRIQMVGNGFFNLCASISQIEARFFSLWIKIGGTLHSYIWEGLPWSNSSLPLAELVPLFLLCLFWCATIENMASSCIGHDSNDWGRGHSSGQTTQTVPSVIRGISS